MLQTTEFTVALRRALLNTEVSVECVEVTGSTSDDLKERIREHPLARPVLRTSERQTAGRGTRGKTWRTPCESLLFTLALPYATQGNECVRLPIVVGISVAESLQRLGYPVGLKWPNDLWLANGKTGGILFEQLNGCAVIGIGINLDADAGVTTQGWPVRSLRDRGPLVRRRSAEAGHMLGIIARDLLDTLGAFPKTPVHCLPALWRAVDAFSNRSVRLCDSDGRSAVRGVVRGITEEGALCLETSDGMRTFRSGSLCPTEP